MDTKIITPNDMKKPVIIECPFPVSALTHLERMEIQFKRSSLSSSLSNYIFLQIEITDFNTLQNIFLAGWYAGYDDGKCEQLSVQCQALHKAFSNFKPVAA